jgi:DNA-binding transcriptional MerR regulator
VGTDHVSIGDVLNQLREEFPDITISKIRFLESQGLVEPERTPSGYRKFYPADVERLRFILRQQKDNFLPLKVIKDRLDEIDRAGGFAGAGGAPVPAGGRGDEPVAGRKAPGRRRGAKRAPKATPALFETRRRPPTRSPAPRRASASPARSSRAPPT